MKAIGYQQDGMKNNVPRIVLAIFVVAVLIFLYVTWQDFRYLHHHANTTVTNRVIVP